MIHSFSWMDVRQSTMYVPYNRKFWTGFWIGTNPDHGGLIIRHKILNRSTYRKANSIIINHKLAESHKCSTKSAQSASIPVFKNERTWTNGNVNAANVWCSNSSLVSGKFSLKLPKLISPLPLNSYFRDLRVSGCSEERIETTSKAHWFLCQTMGSKNLSFWEKLPFFENFVVIDEFNLW